MKRIVVGLDGSVRAPGVLATGVALARASGGQLFLVRAVGLPPEVPQDFWKSTDEPLIDLLRHRAAQYLRECASTVPTALLGSSDVLVGVPWQAVCEEARRLDADLIVIGSHGYAGVDRLLGTTAARVVNHATCSVLVVRDGQHGAPLL